MNQVAVIAALVALGAAAPALACPDWKAAPHFGTIDLRAGFEPDPHVQRITAGGTTDLRRCFSTGEAGFVTTRPDFDLNWYGQSDRLTIAAQVPGADAILLVNTPSGEWYYSDDERGSDPALTFTDPEPGLYDIWIGTYDGSRRNPGLLIFTELDW